MWKWIKTETLAAVDDLIEQRRGKVVLTTATAKPLQFKSFWRQMTCWVDHRRRPKRGWAQARWFLVDADTAGAPDARRVEVTLLKDPEGNKLTFDPAGAGEVLGKELMVHAAYSDDMELQMLCQLREALAVCTRGPQLESLWSAAALVPALPVRGLNAPQAQALTAMSTAGGAFVWGPPGTGKTKVIVEAVAAALAAGRSVLIASHTHVAVDNVVADVAETVPAPGTIIRVGDPSNFTAAVAEHPHLTVDKAAAHLTNRASRLEAIDAAAAVLREDPARAEASGVEQRIADIDVDVDQVQRGWAVQQRLDETAVAIAGLEATRGGAVAEAERYRGMLEEFPDAAGRVHAATEDLRLAEVAAARARRTATELQQAALAIGAALGQAIAARSAAESKPVGMVFGRRRAQQQFEEARASEAELTGRQSILSGQSAAAAAAAAAAEREVARARVAAQHAQERAGAAEQYRARREELLRQAEVAGAQLVGLRAAQLRARDDLEVALAGAEDLLEVAQAAGLFELLAARDALVPRIKDLDAAAADLAAQRLRLEDEFKQTRRRLLENAPVIACTLAAMTTAPELVRRRFDVVIIDEAASAGIGHLIYAGAKADATLVYVGDFLQNEPIGDVDDAVTVEQQRLRRWQVGDIFGLHGIRDRRTAEANPRCVALRTQYRYPPVIAGIVNDFCYDGLLESAWHGAEDPPHVIFLDTTGHPAEGLRRVGGSWSHPLGLELLGEVCRRHELEDSTIGLLTPYKAHAEAARGLAQRGQLRVEAGTSHKFQGRQFPVVVFDLMQDSGQGRWVAGADLHGASRHVQAAKLLNVGITRAQRTLYLVGDWSYIAAQPAPGMRAIRALDGHPHFARVPAAAFLAGLPL